MCQHLHDSYNFFRKGVWTSRSSPIIQNRAPNTSIMLIHCFIHIINEWLPATILMPILVRKVWAVRSGSSGRRSESPFRLTQKPCFFHPFHLGLGTAALMGFAKLPSWVVPISVPTVDTHTASAILNGIV